MGDSRSSQAAFSIAVAALGNLVEWFDWYTYGALALYFAPVFFPRGDLTAQLLDAAGVFAIGFLVRPIGGWILGAYADRRGRRAGLTLAVALMSLGSLLLAVTPGYGQIGALAPALLLIARLMQGLSVGGEYGAAAAFMVEIAPTRARGFASSFYAVTGIMGQLLAVGVLVILQRGFLTAAQLESWGWRIPFLLNAGCSLILLVLRRRLPETAVFAARRPERVSLRLLLRHWRAAALAFGLTLGGTVAYYTDTTYAQKFLVNSAGFSRETASAISAASLLVYMLLQPAFGALSDRIGRRPLLIGFGVLGTVLTVPLMTLLGQTRDPIFAFLLLMAALVIVSGYSAVNAVVKAELFPTEVRASGVALPYAVCVSLFGGTAEYLALWLKRIGHEPWFAWYVAACVFVSLVTYWLMPETRGRDLTTP